MPRPIFPATPSSATRDTPRRNWSRRRRRKWRSLQAAVKADQALIDQANVQLSYTRLTSAIPGITGVRQIDIGNVIHPTDPNGLVVVTQIEPISLLFTLPQSDLPAIQDADGEGADEGHRLQPGRQDQAR